MEIMLEDGLEDHHHCPLDHLVLAAGFPDGPLFPLVLLDPPPLDGRRDIPLVAEPLVQLPQGGVQVLGVLLRRDVVHTWGTALLDLAIGFQQELLVDHVKHVVEHHRRIALGLLGNFLEFHGYGW
jgi:hypothetical protein